MTQPQPPEWQQPTSPAYGQPQPPPLPVPVVSYPPYQQPNYQQPVIVADTRPTSGMSVASMVLGILGLVSSCCTFGIFSILAVILGHFGLYETRTGTVKGHGMAMAGLVMGYVVAAPAIALSIWVVFLGGIGAMSGGAGG